MPPPPARAGRQGLVLLSIQAPPGTSGRQPPPFTNARRRPAVTGLLGGSLSSAPLLPTSSLGLVHAEPPVERDGDRGQYFAPLPNFLGEVTRAAVINVSANDLVLENLSIINTVGIVGPHEIAI